VIGRLFHSLLATSVVAATAAGASYGVTHWLPQGQAHDMIERWVTAPGQAIYARLEKNRTTKKGMKEGEDRLSQAGRDLKKYQDSALGRELSQTMTKAQDETQRLMHLYNVGAWAGVGFVVCLVLTLFFGIESIGAALSLGFKVTLALVFLQGALILGGVLVFQKLAG